MEEQSAVNEILNGSGNQLCSQGMPKLACLNGQFQPGPPMTDAQWALHRQHAEMLVTIALCSL